MRKAQTKRPILNLLYIETLLSAIILLIQTD